MRATEAAALAIAVEAFKKIYAKPDLRHYSVEYVRHGNELKITFLTDSDGTNTIGGGNSFGPDMTYVRIAQDPEGSTIQFLPMIQPSNQSLEPTAGRYDKFL